MILYPKTNRNEIETVSQFFMRIIFFPQKFAGEGLRTLVLAERRLTKEFFDSWLLRQREAALSIDGTREDKLGAIYDEIECDMQLIGVTAIEDKLQDGVPETIASLIEAKINVWVLTGDKQETAINIGYSCKLLSHGMDLIILNEDSLDVSAVTTLLKRSVTITPFPSRTPATASRGTSPNLAISCARRTTWR